MRNLQPGGDGLSVLILEDNPIDVELVSERLSLGGYRFDTSYATCRAEFENRIAGRTFDLILADFSLPDFDGLSALAMIRERDAHLPFIFVSGVLGEDVAVETLHRGATDYVLKQRLERLLPAVARALKGYSEHLSRLEIESKLRETEQLFERVTDALPAMVWTADEHGNLVYSNRAWSNYLGGTSPLSWCDRSIMHIEDLSQCSRQWQEALRDGRSLELECRFRRAHDDSYRWHLVRATPLRTSDPHSPWLGTCTDIEAQKQREESLRISEKLAVVGRMAGVIAHEINNPLESLVNLLYLLRDVDTRIDPGKSRLHEAEQQLFRISSITRQTLTFYRDKALLGEISCRTLFEDTVSLFGPRLRQKGIRVDMTVSGDLSLQGRTGELRQVLINLVSNAIDASPDEGVLGIRARPLSGPDGEFIQMQVEDSGKGIPLEIQKQLFQPFFSTKGALGTGLGLWVSRNIVDAHRGRIDLSSAPGRTVVSVTLPAEFAGERGESLVLSGDPESAGSGESAA